MKTQNAISAEQNTLSKVDDFNITLDKPQRGKMALHITLGELAPVTCDLWAASDDLQQIKEWMVALLIMFSPGFASEVDVVTWGQS